MKQGPWATVQWLSWCFSSTFKWCLFKALDSGEVDTMLPGTLTQNWSTITRGGSRKVDMLQNLWKWDHRSCRTLSRWWRWVPLWYLSFVRLSLHATVGIVGEVFNRRLSKALYNCYIELHLTMLLFFTSMASLLEPAETLKKGSESSLSILMLQQT